jgi:hypothetical protein
MKSRPIIIITIIKHEHKRGTTWGEENNGGGARSEMIKVHCVHTYENSMMKPT